jgi:hypothetical protein
VNGQTDVTALSLTGAITVSGMPNWIEILALQP